MNVLGVGAPAPASLSSSALHFRLKVTNILPPSPIYHSRTVSDESKPQLDAGIAIKLRAAGTARRSQVPLPTATEGITGVKWKRLARDAELTAAEMGYLHDWLEANYGEVVAERFTRPLPVISNDVNVTSGPQVSGDEVTSSMSKLKIARMVGAGSAETTFQKLFKEGQPGVNSLFEEQEGANPSAEIAVSATERADVLAHGFSSGMIATLTWFLHTARPPPINSSDFCYGVDPSSVRKLYSGMQSSVGTLLWELVKSNTSTMRDFQDHFYRATQASSDYPAVRQRLSNHWIEMTQYFDDARLVRSYYKKFLTIRSGRGLPKLSTSTSSCSSCAPRWRRGAARVRAAEICVPRCRRWSRLSRSRRASWSPARRRSPSSSSSWARSRTTSTT